MWFLQELCLATKENSMKLNISKGGERRFFFFKGFLALSSIFTLVPGLLNVRDWPVSDYEH